MSELTEMRQRAYKALLAHIFSPQSQASLIAITPAIIVMLDEAIVKVNYGRDKGERDIAMFRLRKGLDTGIALTLRKNGEAFGVSRGVAHEVEGRILDDLRHSSSLLPLRNAVPNPDAIPQ